MAGVEEESQEIRVLVFCSVFVFCSGGVLTVIFCGGVDDVGYGQTRRGRMKRSSSEDVEGISGVEV